MRNLSENRTNVCKYLKGYESTEPSPILDVVTEYFDAYTVLWINKGLRNINCLTTAWRHFTLIRLCHPCHQNNRWNWINLYESTNLSSLIQYLTVGLQWRLELYIVQEKYWFSLEYRKLNLCEVTIVNQFATVILMAYWWLVVFICSYGRRLYRSVQFNKEGLNSYFRINCDYLNINVRGSIF